jgi:hypothetical protein
MTRELRGSRRRLLFLCLLFTQRRSTWVMREPRVCCPLLSAAHCSAPHVVPCDARGVQCAAHPSRGRGREDNTAGRRRLWSEHGPLACCWRFLPASGVVLSALLCAPPCRPL